MMFRLRAAACAFGFMIAGVFTTADPARAFTTPFTFHCTGNACRVVAFVDEKNGCTVVTNFGRAPVHITQGSDQLTYDLAPGETKAPLINVQCYGYYDGGETANHIGPSQ